MLWGTWFDSSSSKFLFLLTIHNWKFETAHFVIVAVFLGTDFLLRDAANSSVTNWNDSLWQGRSMDSLSSFWDLDNRFGDFIAEAVVPLSVLLPIESPKRSPSNSWRWWQCFLRLHPLPSSALSIPSTALPLMHTTNCPVWHHCNP